MTLKIDFITHDPKSGEYVMYLVETGSWDSLSERLKQMQDRVYDAFDFAVDGHLAKLKPETKGASIRIQIDAHDNPPPDVGSLIDRLSDHFLNTDEYTKSVESSEFISGLRIVYKAL